MGFRRISLLFFVILFAARVSMAAEAKNGDRANGEDRAGKIERSIADGVQKAWESIKKTGRDVSQKISEAAKQKERSKPERKSPEAAR